MTKRDTRTGPSRYLHQSPPQPVQYPAVPAPVMPFTPYQQQVMDGAGTAPPSRYSVSVTVLSDPGAAVAQASFTPGDSYSPTLTVTGSSSRSPEDDYDPDAGAGLAVARALIKMGLKLEREARGRIRHQESVRQAQQEKREAAAAATAPPPEVQAMMAVWFPDLMAVMEARGKGRHAKGPAGNAG